MHACHSLAPLQVQLNDSLVDYFAEASTPDHRAEVKSEYEFQYPFRYGIYHYFYHDRDALVFCFTSHYIL